MADLYSLLELLEALLEPNRYQDLALNGLQVESGVSEIRKVACAVDSGLSVINRAIDENAQLLIVHHGLYWGEQMPIRGPFGKKVRALIEGGCSLYAAHLPLDGNVEVGNAFELARYLELDELAPFAEYKGNTIGAAGVPAPRGGARGNLEYFMQQLSQLSPSQRLFVLPFGREEIRKVGIVTGSGTFAAHACAGAGIDLLISGEPKQEAYHLAKELGLNMIFAGHYDTETFGVKALARRIAPLCHVETLFIDEPTGI